MKQADFVELVRSVDLSWFPIRLRMSAILEGKKVRFTLAMRGGVDVANPDQRIKLKYSETIEVQKFTRARALYWIRQTLLNGLGHELDECLRVVSFTRPFDPHRPSA